MLHLAIGRAEVVSSDFVAGGFTVELLIGTRGSLPGLASPSPAFKGLLDSPEHFKDLYWTCESTGGESTSTKSWTRSSTSLQCFFFFFFLFLFLFSGHGV